MVMLTNILITGATGNIGSALTQYLSAQNIPFVAMVRRAQEINGLDKLPGASIKVGDFNDSSSLTAALKGIDTAFLLTPSSELAEAQQKRFVDVSQAAGVKHIVKLSQWAASVNSPVRFLRYHAAVEQHIQKSGMSYTFLRPNLFMQGLLGLKDYIANKGVFFASVGNAQISAVDVRDIAEVAAAALTDSSHQNKTYELSGPEALTHFDMASKLSAALGRTIHFTDTAEVVMHDALLKAGFPLWQADGLLEDYAHYRNLEAVTVTSDVQKVTGHAARNFDQFARDYAPAFGGSRVNATGR
jgi:uncharacterized protein YbjT (DUF2867 family)